MSSPYSMQCVNARREYGLLTASQNRVYHLWLYMFYLVKKSQYLHDCLINYVLSRSQTSKNDFMASKPTSLHAC